MSKKAQQKPDFPFPNQLAQVQLSGRAKSGLLVQQFIAHAVARFTADVVKVSPARYGPNGALAPGENRALIKRLRQIEVEGRIGTLNFYKHGVYKQVYD